MQNQQREHSYIPASFYNRSDRFLISDDGYHYKTRENSTVGPFATQSEACFDLNIFIHITEIEQELRQGKIYTAA